MNKASWKIIDKVIENGYSLDTRKYRYRIETVNGEYCQYRQVTRLDKSLLDTTDAINGWSVVAIVVNGKICRI